MRDRFEATGPVLLRGAQISGNLECSNATFNGEDDYAFSADGAVIKGDVLLNEEFKAAGTVRLLATQIGGELNCGGATFKCKSRVALSADRALIKGSVFFNRHFKAIGEVRLLGIQIEGNFSCGSATLCVKDGAALSADRAIIKGSVFFNDQFRAFGQVRFLGVQIGGNLSYRTATLDGNAASSLSLDRATIGGSLFFEQLANSPSDINLAYARVGQLVDDAASWGNNIGLDGFQYDSIAGSAPTDAKTRISWLDKQSRSHSGLDKNSQDFRPQPWRQLQKVLREMGHIEEARKVAIAFEHRLRYVNLIGIAPTQNRLLNWLYRIFVRGVHWLFWILTGYGYRPLRLVAWTAVIWLACGAFYWTAALEQGVFAPSNPLVFQNEKYVDCKSSKSPGVGAWYLCAALPEEYTTFSPLAYSLDVILPLVDLQQERDWAPLIPTPKAFRWNEFWTFDINHVTRLVIWFETLFGWVASLLLVAIVSGLAKRRED
jgi:hypothetical protein